MEMVAFAMFTGPSGNLVELLKGQNGSLATAREIAGRALPRLGRVVLCDRLDLPLDGGLTAAYVTSE
jgi:hypothetical protein